MIRYTILRRSRVIDEFFRMNGNNANDASKNLQKNVVDADIAKLLLDDARMLIDPSSVPLSSA